MPIFTFSHPEPLKQKQRIFPVFLPFAGCPHRCIFCSQTAQTGQSDTSSEKSLDDALQKLELDLSDAHEAGRGPYELAFYGGTFTALPAPYPELFLQCAQKFREKGIISRVRCSTRPDSVDENSLKNLKSLGLDCIELGIQSFNNSVLEASYRGYSAETARTGCSLVQNAGIQLGVQLLPGLPQSTTDIFKEDIRETIAVQPDFVRIYPCVVVAHTPLAHQFSRKQYTPWSEETVLEALPPAVLQLWLNNIRVVRLGLAPEPALAENQIAGITHPALGQAVRARALLLHLQTNCLSDQEITQLQIPRRYQGEFFGHKQELIAEYKKLGISPALIQYSDEPIFSVFTVA